MNEAADFKSAVSTDFTTRAAPHTTHYCQTKKPLVGGWQQYSYSEKSGGAARSRTGLAGFAIRYITALLPRLVKQFLQ